MELIKGGNASLADTGISRNFSVYDVRIDIDVSAFLLNEFGQVLGDSCFIFYNQPESECGSLTLNLSPNNQRNKRTFFVKSLQVPENIHRIVFTLSAEKK